jgi:hypothetical protein
MSSKRDSRNLHAYPPPPLTLPDPSSALFLENGVPTQTPVLAGLRCAPVDRGLGDGKCYRAACLPSREA